MPALASPRSAALLGSAPRRDIVQALADLSITPAEPGAPTRRAGLSAPELADRLGLHVTTVRFHLDQLLAAGLVVPGGAGSAGPGRRGRPPKRFAVNPVPRSASRDDLAHRLLAELLADSWTGAALTLPSPEEAGRGWAHRHTRAVPEGTLGPDPATTAGQWLGKVGQVVDVLDEWGYAPEVRMVDQGRTAEVSLSHCPFLELARTHEAVVCGIHRGLLRGAVEGLGETGTVVSLEPFVDPHHCRARLTASTPFEERGPR